MDAARPRAMAAGGGLAVAATLVSGSLAHAATFEVDTTSDDNLSACTATDDDCSLRGAITAANMGGNANSTITFASDVTGTISLGSDLPMISNGETITGPGASRLAVDLFDAGAYTAVDTTAGPVQISGLTFKRATRGFMATGSNRLTLSGMQLLATQSTGADGVFAHTPLTVENSTTSGFGDAIFNDQDLIVRNSTVANASDVGVWANGAATIENSTIAANGGGSSAAINAGLYANGSVALRSSIVAGNTNADVKLGVGATLTENFSLIQNDLGLALQNGSGDNLNGQDPKILPLGGNGNQTQTMRLDPSSPVIDKGKDFAGTGKDQRGVGIADDPSIANAADGRDMGATEFVVPHITSLSPNHGSGGDTVTITGTNLLSVRTVKFGSRTATFSFVDDTHLSAIAPAGSGPVDVTLDGDAPSPVVAADKFTFPNAPAYEVDTTSDDASLSACTTAAGDCSLRGAITAAEANTTPDAEITFASSVTGTITLGSNLPNLRKGETVAGPGPKALTLDANHHYGFVTRTDGGDVTISGLAITNGDGGYGGAIYSTGSGDLTLSRMALSGNTAFYSGAVSANALTLEDSTVSENTSKLGLAAVGAGKLTMSNATIAGNTGGGVASYGGGGTIENSTIAGNSGIGFSASGPGTLRSSIVAGNTGGDFGGGGALTVNFSLIQNTTGLPALAAGSGDNLNSQDPKLGALADNGGATKTMKPASDSPVIDKGKDYSGSGEDQRAIALFDDAAIANAADGRDIGAVELATPSVSSLSPASGNAGDTVTITGANFTRASSVKFGSADAASFSVVDASHITAVAPAGSGTVDVTVTTPDGTTAGGKTFHYLAVPTVAGLSPNHGPKGTTVTITGTNFTGATGVKFGAAAATGVTVVDDTHVTAKAPAGKGTVDVTVTGPDGTSTTVAADKYRYTATDAAVRKKLKGHVISPHFVVKKKTLVFGDKLPEAGKATYKLRVAHKRGKKVKQLGLGKATSVTVAKGKTVKVTIHLGSKGWAALRHNPKGKLSLLTSFKRKFNSHVLKTTRTTKPKHRPRR